MISRLSTPRCLLLPIQPDDLPFITELWSDPQVMRYLPTGVPRSLEQTRHIVDYLASHWEEYGFGVWGIQDAGTKGKIGYCGLQHLHAGPGGISEAVASQVREVELLYGLSPEYWGKGYAFEAARAALAHGFNTLRLRRVVAAIHPDNGPSRAILERLGMRETSSFNFYGDCPHFCISAEQYPA